MNQNTSLVLLSGIVLGALLFLAVHFDRWWIILFFVLLSFTSKTETTSKT